MPLPPYRGNTLPVGARVANTAIKLTPERLEDCYRIRSPFLYLPVPILNTLWRRPHPGVSLQWSHSISWDSNCKGVSNDAVPRVLGVNIRPRRR